MGFVRFTLVFSSFAVMLISLLLVAQLLIIINEHHRFVEIVPTEEVYESKFLCNPEAWNKVFINVSAVLELWNATIPSNLAGKSIPEIAEMYRANVDHSNAEYAYCYVEVPEINYESFIQTFEELGFDVIDVAFEHQNVEAII